MDTPELNAMRLDRAEEDIKSLKEDMKMKTGKEDHERLETSMSKLVTKEHFDDTKKEILGLVDSTKEALETEIGSLEKNLTDKVSKSEFQPIKWIFGTIVTIFSGVILTQIAVWLFGEH